MKKLTKKEIEKIMREIEETPICPLCGCKNDFHYSSCPRVAHLSKKAR